MSLTQINSAGIADGAIVNADINSSADIALSKLDTSGTASDSNFLRGDGAWTAIDLTALSASNLTSGTVPDARFPSTLPALNGSALTALTAGNISSGTVSTSRLGSGTASSSTFLRGDNSWVAVNTDLVSDTSPQLGGNLDCNDFSLVTTSGNQGIQIDPHGTGDIVLQTTTGAKTQLNGIGGDVQFVGWYSNGLCQWDYSQAQLEFWDGVKASFGSDEDLAILHDGNHSYLNHNGTGSVFLQTSGGFYVQKYGTTDRLINANNDGAVEIFHAGALHFYTRSDGAECTRTGGDATITVRGKEGYSGIFKLASDDGDDAADYVQLKQEHSTESFRIQPYSPANNAYEDAIVVKHDAGVELYFNNSKKAETVTGGFTVSGTCTATAFAGDGSNLSGVAAFASGTKMIFQQTSAPTGWTKVTSSVDNRALRVVSGSAGSGGSAAFTSAFSSQSVSGSIANTTAGGSISTNNTSAGGTVHNHTLSTSEIPSHRHTGGAKGIWDAASGQYGTISNVGNLEYPLVRYTNGYANYDLYYTSYTGSGNAHNHGFSGSSHNHSGSFSGSAHNHSFSGSAIDLAVQYIDVIIASKD